MVLGCFMCRKPLLPILNHEQKISKSNQYGLTVLGKGSNGLSVPWRLGKSFGPRPLANNPSTTPKEKEFDKEKFQPMTTKCGHIFHRGCLKEFSLQLCNRPAAPGNPVLCPICSKGFIYSHCFNIYLDAVPDTTPDNSDKYIRLLDLEDENVEIKQNINIQREEIEKNMKTLKELREKIQIVGQDILRKGDDLTQFKKYTNRVGSITELVDRLSYSRENYINLRAQNSQLYRLVKNQSSIQQNTRMDPGLNEQVSSIKRYVVPDDLIGEFYQDEVLDDEEKSSISEPSIEQIVHSSSDEEIIPSMLPKLIPPPLALQAIDIANKNYETVIYNADDIDNFDAENNIDQPWNHRYSEFQAPSKILSKPKFSFNQELIEKHKPIVTSTSRKGAQVKELESSKLKKNRKNANCKSNKKIRNKIKLKKTNPERNFAKEMRSIKDEIRSLLNPPLDHDQIRYWEKKRAEGEGTFSAKDYECLRLK